VEYQELSLEYVRLDLPTRQLRGHREYTVAYMGEEIRGKAWTSDINSGGRYHYLKL
jgi:hypothetical protein